MRWSNPDADFYARLHDFLMHDRESINAFGLEFQKPTATDVIGAVVHKEPDLQALSSKVPARIRRLLTRCLEKDSSRRLQSIGEARITLQEWLENPETEEVETADVPRRSPWLAAAGIAAGIVLGTLVGATLLGGGDEPEQLRRFEINVSEQGLFSRLGSGIVVSPDGSKIAYTTGQEGQTQALVLRPLDRFQETVLASGQSGSGPYHPFFSPDSDWLGYVTPGELKKISANGGAPITLAEVDRSRGASWGPDGTIVYARSILTGLSLISAAGGDPKPLTELDVAFFGPGWGHDRMLEELEGEQRIVVRPADVDLPEAAS